MCTTTHFTVELNDSILMLDLTITLRLSQLYIRQCHHTQDHQNKLVHLSQAQPLHLLCFRCIGLSSFPLLRLPKNKERLSDKDQYVGFVQSSKKDSHLFKFTSRMTTTTTWLLLFWLYKPGWDCQQPVECILNWFDR